MNSPTEHEGVVYPEPQEQKGNVVVQLVVGETDVAAKAHAPERNREKPKETRG